MRQLADQHAHGSLPDAHAESCSGAATAGDWSRSKHASPSRRMPIAPKRRRNLRRPERRGTCQRDLDHIRGFEPVLSSQHQNAMHASLQALTVRIKTMTRFHGLSIVTIGAALSMTAGLAFAGDTVSADQILDALKPKPA